MQTIFRYLIAFLFCYASLYVGYLFFRPDALEWYEHLRDYAVGFPIVVLIPMLLIIFGITAFATGLLWNKVHFWHQWPGAFFISLMFNSAWMMFLIGYYAVFLALFVVVCMIVIVVTLLLSALETNRLAAYLFIPYSLWTLYILYFTADVWLSMGS